MYNHIAYGNNYCRFIDFFQHSENVQCKVARVSSSDAKERADTDIAVSKGSGCEGSLVGSGSKSESVREKQADDVCAPEELVNTMVNEKAMEAHNEEGICDPEMKDGHEDNDDEADLRKGPCFFRL